MSGLTDIDDVGGSAADGGGLIERLRASMPIVEQRCPDPGDRARWHRTMIGGVERTLALPVTFTPYASARPCSARCRFCSETLRPLEGGRNPATLRPSEDYFDGLAAVLRQLRGVPLGYSLSGLEATDDREWFLRLLGVLSDAAIAAEGPQVGERVLYSNGTGFGREGGNDLIDALEAFDISWVELSRHHPAARDNNAIMRFRDGEPIAAGERFERVAARLSERMPVKLVCILQRGGIDDAGGVAAYLDWARRCGVRSVVFRELSRLGQAYRETVSRRYVDSSRVALERVIADCMRQRWWQALEPLRFTEGYYFWNVQFGSDDGMEVVFESSDYPSMHARHATGEVYKLVYFANGRLCSGWDPERDLLWESAEAARMQ